MTAQEYIAELERKSEKAGQRNLLAHLVERRLRRPLSETELAALQGRVESLGAEQVSDVVIDLSADALAAWLSEASVA